MLGSLRSAGPGDVLIFSPELLAGTHYYALLFPEASGQLVEECSKNRAILFYSKKAIIEVRDNVERRDPE